MNQCKKCGSLTKNKKFCSKKCQFDYKKKKKSKLEFFIYEQIKKDFYHLDIIQNDRTVLNENLELDLSIKHHKTSPFRERDVRCVAGKV